jgi:hypothetical protein
MIIHEWNRAGKIGAEAGKKQVVGDAVAKFLADARARQLREGTIELYDQCLLSDFEGQCQGRIFAPRSDSRHQTKQVVGRKTLTSPKSARSIVNRRRGPAFHFFWAMDTGSIAGDG